jgi:probable rRNA maturation factor
VAVWLHSDKYPQLKITNKRILKSWVKNSVDSYDKVTGNINIIFLDDVELLEMNKRYLNHDFYTDVITFNYNEGNFISGDIYISVDRVADNARIHKTAFNDECLRVVIHGILHLLGLTDSSEKGKERMRSEESRLLVDVKATLIFSK